MNNRREKEKKYSLTQRATLTFISNILTQGAKFLVGIVVTPFLAHGLGKEMFGAWQMILQTVGYLALGDLRPMSTLKFTLAVTQHLDDVQQKRRQLGAAVVLWAASLPLMFALGGAAIWSAPWFIRVDPANAWMVRVAMCFIVLGIVLDRIVSLPGNVLRGTNQDYKQMGLNAIATLISGLIMLPAIWIGWGLPGVAGASILGTVFLGIVQYWIARQAVPWLGLARPSLKEFGHFTVLSLWLLLSTLSFLFLNATDVFIVGYILGPPSAAVYAMTGAVMRFTVDPLVQLLSSGGPGIAGLCGAGQWSRIAELRSEMHLLAITVLAVVCSGVIAMNGTFVGLWVGVSYYGGNAVNIAMVIAAAATISVRVDSLILDSVLAFRLRAISMLLAGLVVVLGGFLLCPTQGLLGMALAALVGKSGLAAFQYVYVSRYLARRQAGESLPGAHHIRELLVAVVCIATAGLAAQYLETSNWLVFIAEAAFVGLLTVVLFWWCGLNSAKRRLLMFRIPAFKKGLS